MGRRMVRVQKWLPAAADVATIVVGVVVIGIVGTRYLSPRTEPPNLDTYVGIHVDALGIDLKQTAKTLVVAVQQGCPACEISMPFYQRITAPTRRERKYRYRRTLNGTATQGGGTSIPPPQGAVADVPRLGSRSPGSTPPTCWRSSRRSGTACLQLTSASNSDRSLSSFSKIPSMTRPFPANNSSGPPACTLLKGAS